MKLTTQFEAFFDYCAQIFLCVFFRIVTSIVGKQASHYTANLRQILQAMCQNGLVSRRILIYFNRREKFFF